MTESLLVVRNEVKSRLMLTNTSEDSRVDSEIRASIRLLMGKPYWFLEKIGSLALSVGVSTVAAPTDFSILGGASIVQNGRRYSEESGEFIVMKYDALEQVYLYASPPTEASRPNAMAIVKNTIYLSNTLTQPSTLSLRYFIKDVPLPVNNADTSVFFDDESIDVVIGLAQSLFEARSQGQQLDSTVVNSFITKLDKEHVRRVMVGMQ